jgi:hypothetical protein
MGRPLAGRVRIGRLRAGELLTAAGAALLLVSLFLDWVGPVRESGWSSLGWLTLLLAVGAVLAGAWLVVATVVVRPVTQVVAAAVLAAVLGPIALIALVVRTAIAQPGADAVTSIERGAYVGLVGALALVVGAWWSMADERTDAPESAYTPPPARPAPPPSAS